MSITLNVVKNILKTPPVSVCLECKDETLLEYIDENLIKELRVERNDTMRIGNWRNTIGIDEIRYVERFVMIPAEGMLKIVRIFGAENMNQESANAFLKTLEEPPKRVNIILYTRNQYRLPSTIRSRTFAFYVRTPDREEILDILKKIRRIDEGKLWHLFVICRMSSRILRYIEKMKDEFNIATLPSFNDMDLSKIKLVNPEDELKLFLYFEIFLKKIIETEEGNKLLGFYDSFIKQLKDLDKDTSYEILKKLFEFFSSFLRDSIMSRIDVNLVEHREFLAYFMKMDLNQSKVSEIMDSIKDMNFILEARKGQIDFNLALLWVIFRIWMIFGR